jgi:predicted permease
MSERFKNEGFTSERGANEAERERARTERAQRARSESARFKKAFRLDRRSGADAHARVAEELQHHMELAIEELVDAGWDEREARHEALRRFGDLSAAQEYCEAVQTRMGRSERRRAMLSFDELRQDVKYAVRSLRNAPGYTALVVLTLSFGIAANTTIFSVMNPYLFRPLPFGEPETLVHVNQINPTTGWDMDRFSYPQYVDWAERSRAFTDVGAYVYGVVNVTGAEGPEQIQHAELTANMFDVLDAPAALGRTFRPEEGEPGGAPVVVLAHGLWERRYGADPGVIGRAISTDGIQRTVIGVMPPEFNFPYGGVKLWIPIQLSAASAPRGSAAYQLVGRLAEGWTLERTRNELVGIQEELAAAYPETDSRMAGVTVKPLREALNFAWDILRVLFVVLLGAVGFVLLIACANVASLTLARGSGRLREISVRAAIGAHRGRIVRQLLTESLVLSLAGGALGVALSYWITTLLDPIIPEDLFKIGGITLDRAVLGFSLFVTLLTPIAFGLMPALSASRLDLTLGLKEGSKGSRGPSSSRGRRALVATQVALAVVLVTSAGLMLRSFTAVQGLDLGFDADRIATAEIVLSEDEYPSAEERRAFMREAVASIARVSGVRATSAVNWLPLNHESISYQVAPAGMEGAPGEEWPLATGNFVHPGYFETMAIDRIAGRDFGALDGPESERVVIVNRTLAERFWPNGESVGQSLLIGDPANPDRASVVGVVGDVRHVDLDPGSVGPQIYRPSLQAGARRFFLVASTAADPADVVGGVRAAMTSLAPNLPLTIRPMNDVVAENEIQWSLGSIFLGIFGVGALLLATLGIYGLVSFSVAQREREMGVRMALGANGSELRRAVLGDGLRLTSMGLLVGLAVALGVGRLISSMLYGVDPADPATFAAVLGLFLGVSALASVVPAARAARTDPIRALRAE